ncbi:hypothetical protein QN277_013045 [Acacia crassicarpa]|uniref:RING-type E3 ubiquitin transferase n=1 Tax=Acacia crassicarpa TaxID=499986 RepID=A0AAE1TEC4_9FABA|nr:hypothetical protein QN277_013045 [Acacia crassicarpa]
MSSNNNNADELQARIDYFVSPLIISGAGIICSCIALATYHFILFRFCLQNRMRLQHMAAHPISPPADNIHCGVDPEVLKKIPILPYSHKKGGAFRLDQTECAICLGELLEGEKVRLLPSCCHAFHIACIDLWFDQNSNCPICRSPLVIPPPSRSPVAASETTVADAEGIRVVSTVSRVQSDRNSGSTTSQSPLGGAATLQHTLSSVSYRHEQEKPLDSMTGMRRSLSMEHLPYASVCIQRGEEHNKAAASSSSSSSSASVAARIGIARAKTIDQVSSMLMMSFAPFRNSRNDRSKGILPN